MNSPSLSNYPLQALASQIASGHGQPTFYGPNNGGQAPQDEVQRHLSILSSLSNIGNGNTYCNTNGVCYQANVRNGLVMRANASLVGSAPLSVRSTTIVLSGGGPPQNLFQDHDPLTIANAPATLIGWANPNSDLATNVTINGNQSVGQQEILVQAPLQVSFAGTFSASPSFLPGQLIDVQGTSTQAVSPGIYTMGTGSMTYEYRVPGGSQFRANTLTMGQIPNLNQTIPTSSTGQAFVDANHLQVKLYNWNTNAWDNFTFSQYMLTVNNAQAYLGLGGRVLVQLANTDTSSTVAVVFNKPLLQIQGTL